MTEVVCVRIRVKDGALPLVEEWARTLRERRDEVLETMRAEGVTVESCFLERAGDGDHLVYVMRARSLEEAYRVGRALTAPIQQYHNEAKKEAWGERTPLRCLFDFESP